MHEDMSEGTHACMDAFADVSVRHVDLVSLFMCSFALFCKVWLDTASTPGKLLQVQMQGTRKRVAFIDAEQAVNILQKQG